MGLKINKKIWLDRYGVLDSIYCRIENLGYQRLTGGIRYTLQFYIDSGSMETTYSHYLGDIPPSSSAVIPVKYYEVVKGDVSGSMSVDIDESGSMIEALERELPLANTVFITGSDDIIEYEYEEQPIYDEVVYTDYDDDGNLVEKTRREEVDTEQVIVSESIVQKNYLLHDDIVDTGLYQIAYDDAKKILDNHFLSGSVIEDIL